MKRKPETRKGPKPKTAAKPLTPEQRKALDKCIEDFVWGMGSCLERNRKFTVQQCYDNNVEIFKDCKREAGIPRGYPPPKRAPGGGRGLVWVDTQARVYHRERTRSYGRTKKGKYITEKKAIQAGHKAAAKRN